MNMVCVVTCGKMLTILLTILAVLGLLQGATIPNHLQEEGHAIVKRFADEHQFEGHDIATVLHEKHPGTFHRINRRDLSSVAKNSKHGEELNRIRLDLTNSGESLRLVLKKRSITDSSTEFYINTNEGRVKRSSQLVGDCFATGHEEMSPDDVAAVSMCNGCHGIVKREGFDYYIHPIEMESNDEEHLVHVLWKRSESGPREDYNNIIDSSKTNIEKKKRVVKRDNEKFDDWEYQTEFTIEMAMFTDAHAWKRLQDIAPGREDEYMLIAMAATNALYGDPHKVGYDVYVKVKLIEHWKVDPNGYDFQESVGNNMGSFCKVTRDMYEYRYDMHFLHTGVTQQEGSVAGVAYMSGVCDNIRCGDVKSLAPSRHSLIAHEMGHNLGFKHHEISNCPDEIKQISGGFMGGGNANDFSPCNKWELRNLFKSGKGGCLFKKTVKNPKNYDVDRPRVLPGQSRSPDMLCELYAGYGYKYFRPSRLSGNGECEMFLCINEDKDSPAYHNVKKMSAPNGFPCGEEMFCGTATTCRPWNSAVIGWDLDYIRTYKQTPEWSSWSRPWSECTRTCGTGVQIKQKECKIKKGAFVSPYCKGTNNIKARLCNQTPCKGDPNTIEELRQKRGDEMCKNFHKNKVKLGLQKGQQYSAKSKEFDTGLGKHLKGAVSCILSCKRDPKSNGEIDGILPSGTPCLETRRTEYNLQRFNIEMRCVKGMCMEFSDCKNNERKDDCGICASKNKDKCMSGKASGKPDYVPKGGRLVLAHVPAGSKDINFERLEKSGKFEIWSEEGDFLVWGEGGEYRKTKYIDDDALYYANTDWYLSNKKFVRAKGPISRSVVVKLLREDSSLGVVEFSFVIP